MLNKFAARRDLTVGLSIKFNYQLIKSLELVPLNNTDRKIYFMYTSCDQLLWRQNFG